MNYAIILAGGIGSRFWPLSRQSKPKQFLNIASGKPLVEETIKRVFPVVKKENIYIAANRMHSQQIKKSIKSCGIPLKNLFLEPVGKNTLAPIAVMSKVIHAIDKDAVIAVLPSDHYVRNTKRFVKLFSLGFKIARRGHIVTFGVPTTRPETGYGYIKMDLKAKIYGLNVFKVDRFIEKPDLPKAKRFLKDKRYYWNSGIFVFRADIMLEEISNIIPKVYGIIAQIKNKGDYARSWLKLPFISFDYAIMEETDKAVILPLKCGWNDLGSWEVLSLLMKKDEDGNIFKGRCLDIGSRDTFVWSDGCLVATLGLKGIILVCVKGAILVCDKDRAQEVKKILPILKQKKFNRFI